MKFEKKMIELRSGQKITIRQPSVSEDLPKLVKFFSRLPGEVRNCLRYNVMEEEPLRKRLGQVDSKDHWRLLAEMGGEIIGDATMDREPYGWTRHVAELRGVIDAGCQRLGLVPILFNELVTLGAESGIELLFTEVMEEQGDLIEMLQDVGFKKEAVRKKYAKDLSGKLHDVIILANDLEGVWNHLADLLEEMDVGRAQGA